MVARADFRGESLSEALGLAKVLRCRECENPTEHTPTREAVVFACSACGCTRVYSGVHGDFAELSVEENEEIHAAREAGYASFFPAYPDADRQASETLDGARRWNG